MNWITRGLTDKKVGFERDGGICEGGNCAHLKRGDRAHAHSSENDSFGSEMYLMCKVCWEQDKIDRQEELVHCNDCRGEFPRKDTRFYKAYDSESIEAEIFRCDLCLPCWNAARHQARLMRDEERRNEDHEAIYGGDDDWEGPDDHDDREDDLDDCMIDLEEDRLQMDSLSRIMSGDTLFIVSGTSKSRLRNIQSVAVRRRNTPVTDSSGDILAVVPPR